MEGAGPEGARPRGRDAGSLRARARGRYPGARDEALRRPAHRRHGAPRRQDRRDEDRRGKDARRHAPLLPERADRPRRPRGHRQRLPGPPRRGVDGPALPHAGDAHRDHRPRPDGPGAPGLLRRRHHVRPEQRVRLRLPARQHEVPVAGLRAAGAQLRHRRRGGLDPHRRGTHAAHHLGTERRVEREVLPGQPGHPLDDPRRRLHGGREDEDRGHDRRRRGEDGAEAQHPKPLRPRADRMAPPRGAGSAGSPPLQERGGVRREGRRGDHRRRVHRSAHAGAPLVGRPAPGGGGQGRGEDRGGEPDPRDHLVPELLPHVLEARRHDRHGGDRGGGVRQDLRPRRGGGAHQPADGPQGRGGRRLQDGAREVHGRLRGDFRTTPGGPAHPGGHGVGGEERGGVVAAQEARHPPQRAERQEPRARGRDRRPGWPQGRGHDLHQHGRARHGHPARRQPGDDGEARGGPRARRSHGGRGRGGLPVPQGRLGEAARGTHRGAARPDRQGAR